MLFLCRKQKVQQPKRWGDECDEKTLLELFKIVTRVGAGGHIYSTSLAEWWLRGFSCGGCFCGQAKPRGCGG